MLSTSFLLSYFKVKIKALVNAQAYTSQDSKVKWHCNNIWHTYFHFINLIVLPMKVRNTSVGFHIQIHFIRSF